jgi:hypothetical protein
MSIFSSSGSIFSSAASKAKKAEAAERAAERAKREAEEEAAKEAVKAGARANWHQWNKKEGIDKVVREREEATAAVEATTKIAELANTNNQKIENIFKDKFKPLKQSIKAQFQEIKESIKTDVNTVIADSKITIDALDINLATITMNPSLNNVDNLLANLNPENLISTLNTYEEQCKRTLNNNLGSGVASVKVTKRLGDPEPPYPYTYGSTPVRSYENPNPDEYRGGGSSRSSKKRRKPIKKRRNTKRRN